MRLCTMSARHRDAFTRAHTFLLLAYTILFEFRFYRRTRSLAEDVDDRYFHDFSSKRLFRNITPCARTTHSLPQNDPVIAGYTRSDAVHCYTVRKQLFLKLANVLWWTIAISISVLDLSVQVFAICR